MWIQPQLKNSNDQLDILSQGLVEAENANRQGNSSIYYQSGKNESAGRFHRVLSFTLGEKNLIKNTHAQQPGKEVFSKVILLKKLLLRLQINRDRQTNIFLSGVKSYNFYMSPKKVRQLDRKEKCLSIGKEEQLFQ